MNWVRTKAVTKLKFLSLSLFLFTMACQQGATSSQQVVEKSDDIPKQEGADDSLVKDQVGEAAPINEDTLKYWNGHYCFNQVDISTPIHKYVFVSRQGGTKGFDNPRNRDELVDFSENDVLPVVGVQDENWYCVRHWMQKRVWVTSFEGASEGGEYGEEVYEDYGYESDSSGTGDNGYYEDASHWGVVVVEARHTKGFEFFKPDGPYLNLDIKGKVEHKHFLIELTDKQTYDAQWESRIDNALLRDTAMVVDKNGIIEIKCSDTSLVFKDSTESIDDHYEQYKYLGYFEELNKHAIEYSFWEDHYVFWVDATTGKESLGSTTFQYSKKQGLLVDIGDDEMHGTFRPTLVLSKQNDNGVLNMERVTLKNWTLQQGDFDKLLFQGGDGHFYFKLTAYRVTYQCATNLRWLI